MRALSIRCRSAPVDVLLVRAADVPEYVQDGAVDCGITGADLVGERDADVVELLRLGFGSCTLEAAVLDDDPAQTLNDLHGRSVATVFPHLARTLLAERGIDVELCQVTGSVEIAPRFGLSDAIVDLVSSGSTLRTNGLRSLGALFESEAVLIALSGVAGARQRPPGRARQCRAGPQHALSHVQRAARPRSLEFAMCCPPMARPVLSRCSAPTRSPSTRSSRQAPSGSCCRSCRLSGRRRFCSPPWRCCWHEQRPRDRR